MKIRLTIAAAIALATLGSSAANADVVATSGIGGNTCCFGGDQQSTTFGVIFTTPDAINTRLDSFTFSIGEENLSSLKLFAGVASWNGMSAGPDLFTSAPFTGDYNTNFLGINPITDDFNYTPVTIDTGGLDLTAGKQYVAFFSGSGMGNPTSDGAAMQTTFTYAGSTFVTFVYDDANGVSPNVDTENWNLSTPGNVPTAAFDFGAPSVAGVPEPATWAMLLAGFGAIGFMLRSSRRKGAAATA
jgi:PEP-CTERM motif